MPSFESPRHVEVGRYYQVPCVRSPATPAGFGKDEWAPVIGPLHEDKEIIGFAKLHFHWDLRFLSQRNLIRYLPSWNTTLSSWSIERTALIYVVTDASEGPVLRLRKCQRLMPDFPWERPSWGSIQQRLEQKYCSFQVNPENPVCPHRGLPLVGVPDHGGVVVCSGHGLSWNLRTGLLAPKAGVAAP